MITGNIKSQIDQIWNAFWSGGIANPLEVIEQITYLLFLRRLDDLHTLEENKSARFKQPLERRTFPDGKDPKGRPYDDLRWSRFKHFAPADMYAVVAEHVFPFLRTLGGDGSTYAHHMKDARFTIPTPALLAKVVDLLDAVPMEDRDTKRMHSRRRGPACHPRRVRSCRVKWPACLLNWTLRAKKPNASICWCGTCNWPCCARSLLSFACAIK